MNEFEEGFLDEESCLKSVQERLTQLIDVQKEKKKGYKEAGKAIAYAKRNEERDKAAQKRNYEREIIVDGDVARKDFVKSTYQEACGIIGPMIFQGKETRL